MNRSCKGKANRGKAQQGKGEKDASPRRTASSGAHRATVLCAEYSSACRRVLKYCAASTIPTSGTSFSRIRQRRIRRKIPNFAAKHLRNGHLGQKETLRRHGENQKQGHEAGMDCAPLPLLAGLPLPQEREGDARHAGHRHAQVRHRHLHPWLFLARAHGRPPAPLQRGFLAGENRTEQAARWTFTSQTDSLHTETERKGPVSG